MPVIRTGAGIVTRIDVVTVPEGGQDAMLDRLAEAAHFVSDTPGRLSSSLHRSHDGTRVVNYTQRRDLDSARSAISPLRGAGYLDRNAALGQAHPGLYDVAFTLER